MHRIVLVAVLVLTTAQATRGGSFFPMPGDYSSSWSPDGTRVAFVTEGPGAPVSLETKVVGADGRGLRTLVPAAAVPAPDWSKLAYVVGRGPQELALVVSTFDGSDERTIGRTRFGAQPSWAPTSDRLVFEAADGAIETVALDSDKTLQVAPAGSSPRWSPDGARVAYVGGAPQDLDVDVVNADGSGTVDLTAGDTAADLDPAWSPDGSRVAYWRKDGISMQLGVVDLAGTTRLYRIPGTAESFAWSPDGTSIVYDVCCRAGGSLARFSPPQRLVRLDLVTGAERELSFGREPAFSRDGSRIAFDSEGDCQDRSGIYVMDANGKGRRRLTSDCRIVGTSRADTLRGTASGDVIEGLGGNDRLVAVDPGYSGDTLVGGPGDDALVGGYRQDRLFGGPGDDRLSGGATGDLLVGGPGHDVIDGGGGRDVIAARDGERDVIRCGTSRGTPERDEVFADRFDVVSADCELVHRA